MALRLNPLSTSKGKKYLCELCGKVAIFACQHCRVTYYCSREHQSVDWFGIHERICQLLGALRTLKSTLGSEDERQRRQLTVQMSQHALIDLCKNEAQKHLVQGQYELAIPGALQSLRFSIEVYGAGRIELVPAYLLLAEANLGLRRLRVAEEFLLYANWSVLKNPDCSNELKSQLCRNFGRLYACQERYHDALQQLAHDVYYSSLEHGPEHVDTAGGYFYMADVFLMMGQVENCFAFFDKVVDIWYKFLISLRHRPNESIGDYLSEAHIAEAGEMLRTILDTRKRRLGALHLATGEAAYALGILKHITGNDTEARHYYSMAHSVYATQVGPDREATKEVLNALNSLGPPKGAAGTSSSVAPAESKTNDKPAVPEAAPISANAPSTVAGTHYTAGAGANPNNASTPTATAGAAAGTAGSNATTTQIRPGAEQGGHHGLYADVSEDAEPRRPPMGRRGSSLLSNRGDNDSLVAAITEEEKQAFLEQQKQKQMQNEEQQGEHQVQSTPQEPQDDLQESSPEGDAPITALDIALRELPEDIATTIENAYRLALEETNQPEDGAVRHESLVKAFENVSPSLSQVLGKYPLYGSCYVLEQLLKHPDELVTWPAVVVLFGLEYMIKKTLIGSEAISMEDVSQPNPVVDANRFIVACTQDLSMGHALDQIGYSSEGFVRSLASMQPLTLRGVFESLDAAADYESAQANADNLGPIEQVPADQAELPGTFDPAEGQFSSGEVTDVQLPAQEVEPEAQSAVGGVQGYEI